jgi:Arc/MetJ-type ribon-helix-helix transcriptional regulator
LEWVIDQYQVSEDKQSGMTSDPNRPDHLARATRRGNVNQRRIYNMTIHLPPGLENPILAAVHSGRYASLDDAMTEAASMLVERLKQEQSQSTPPLADQPEAVPAHKPIWEVVDDLRKSIPPDEFAKLPKDGAEQLDHYLYGSPKRPTT